MKHAAALRLSRILVAGVVLMAMPTAVAWGQAAPAGGAVESGTSSERAEIEEVLVRMGEAVRAGDIGAYLSLVDSRDGVFHMEQRNWAKDLERGAPEVARFSIVDDGELGAGEFGAERAEFGMETVWRFEGWKNERRVRTRVVFTKAGSGGAGEEEAKPGWKFAGEAWDVMENDAGVVKYMGEEFRGHAQMVLDALPEVREHVETGFEVALGHRQEVKVYPRMDHLQWSIYLRYTDGLAGWNEPGESVKLLGETRPRRRGVVGVLAHEMGHCATFAMGEHANEMAWWILEGVAELAAERYEPGKAKGVDAMVRTWASAEGGLAAWEDLADFHTVEARWQGHVYVQGQHMAGYISERWKRSGRNEWLKAMAAGKSLDAATRDVMGMSFAELDAAWRESLKRAPEKTDGADAKEGAEKKESGPE